MLNKAVFLDRDGVINEGVVSNGKPYPPACLEDFRFLPGVSSALMAMHKAKLKLIVVTNQPDVRTGKQEKHIVEAMHQKIFDELPIDDVFVCYHIDKDNCMCRKPKPGMLYDAAEKWDIDLNTSFLVGDRWRDIEAGQAAGCQTIFVNYNYLEQKPKQPDHAVSSLIDALSLILPPPSLSF